MDGETEQNPFTMLLTAIWEMLIDHPAFARDVKEGNRIRFDSLANRDPLKDPVEVADMPEVAIVAESVTANLMQTSSTSQCTRIYSILISTGDNRYSAFLGQIEWDVFVALLGWKTKLTGLRWRGKSFVKRTNVTTARSGLSDPKQNRNLKGWSAVWSIEVEMHFDTQDLQKELSCFEALAN